MLPLLPRSSLRLLGLAISLVLVLLVLAGCQRASRQGAADGAPDVAMTLAVAPDPAIVGPATAIIELTDAAGQPIEGARLSLKGDMSHPGMQPVLAEAVAEAGGGYRAELQWTMAGDWFVVVTASLPDGRTAVRRFDLTVQSP